ncbi:MAG: CDP-alcohol phosphatidyltransferase family protein [Spirochaetales bacterium]|nr:CDP-alcohol phosphatidyltransferase family protein [Spirochaetales bacterium]
MTILVLYLAIQGALFSAYAIPLGFFGVYFWRFALTSTAFHATTFALYLLFKNDFVIEPSGVVLERVNRANKITLFRISTLPTILFVLLASKDYPMRFELVALVAIVFATDFLDGYVSRRDKETTRIGKMMDSAGDYSLLFVISVVFHYYRIIPTWFLWLLVFRLAGQGVMVLAVLAVKKRITPRTSFLGKVTVAATMVLYAFELLRFVADIPPVTYEVLEYIVGAIIAVSVVDKVLLMVRDLQSKLPEPPGTGRLNSTLSGDKHVDD